MRETPEELFAGENAGGAEAKLPGAEGKAVTERPQ